jgi:fatty-acyl-CoA synthase
VLGVADERWGERPVALVVLRTGFEKTVAGPEIRSHVEQFAANGTVPRFAVPEYVEIVASLARTSVGKLDKKLLREQLAQRLPKRP